MGVYPRSWKRADPKGAAAALAGSAQVLDVADASGRLDARIELELTGSLTGYTARFAEIHLLFKHYLYCHFVTPVTWPLVSIVAHSHNATDGEGAEWPTLHAFGDYEVRSPMPEQTGRLLAAGLSVALQEHPVRALQITPSGASIELRSGARLNAETAHWLLSIVTLVLHAAPPFATQDLIVDDPGVAMTRVASLREDIGSADAFVEEPIAPATAQLQAQLVDWCAELDRLDLAQRCGAVDRDEVTVALNDMRTRWAPVVWQAKLAGADPETVSDIEQGFERIQLTA